MTILLTAIFPGSDGFLLFTLARALFTLALFILLHAHAHARIHCNIVLHHICIIVIVVTHTHTHTHTYHSQQQQQQQQQEMRTHLPPVVRDALPPLNDTLRATLGAHHTTDENFNTALLVKSVADVHRLTGVLSLSAELARQSSTFINKASESIEAVRGRLMPMTAAFESFIMVQHGPFLTYHDRKAGNMVPIESPPCVNGATDANGHRCCVGMSGSISGFTKAVPGVVLMAYIFEKEYNEMKRTGKRPRDWHLRGCVLCVRREVNDCIVKQKVQGTALPLPLIIQPWDSPCGMPGAYLNDCVHSVGTVSCSNSDGIRATTNGLVVPFVKFLVHH